jgi:hypothetical protein
LVESGVPTRENFHSNSVVSKFTTTRSLSKPITATRMHVTRHNFEVSYKEKGSTDFT